MDKIKLKQALIVEGKYDKIKLSSIIDAPIITTNGFSIFTDTSMQKYIRKIAAERGIIILTDSDAAGQMIRGKISSFVPQNQIVNAYIPQICGKEKRKRTASKQGLLGVEGVDVNTIRACLNRAGITEQSGTAAQMTKADLYELGLSGRNNSASLRKKVLQALDFPDNLSSAALLDALNIFTDKNELSILINDLSKGE